jgi:hypothetical protein
MSNGSPGSPPSANWCSRTEAPPSLRRQAPWDWRPAACGALRGRLDGFCQPSTGPAGPVSNANAHPICHNLPMCGRYRLSRRKQIVEEYFGSVSGEEDWNPRYNIPLSLSQSFAPDEGHSVRLRELTMCSASHPSSSGLPQRNRTYLPKRICGIGFVARLRTCSRTQLAGRTQRRASSTESMIS